MNASLTALLQLASPALPVGAYSYSQGLESAIEAGFVSDEASARTWISDALRLVIARYEAPVWLRVHRAIRAGHSALIQQWNEDFLATRETAELRAETVQMGYSMAQLMRMLGHDMELFLSSGALPDGSLPCTPPLRGGGETFELAYPVAQAWACCCWNIAEHDGLVAYLYGWVENQVMAALKTLPLGQSAGQRLLFALREDIATAVRIAEAMEDEQLSTQTPMLAILSSRHETQYSRLFRS